MTEEQALKRLRAAANQSTQQALARQLGVSPQYLSNVLLGHRDPAHVLRRFGLKRVIRYEEGV